MYNDLVDQCELFNEAIKYYANILAPFSSILRKKIDEIIALDLPLDMIAPSHGIIWREDPMEIVEKYSQWADDYQENQITIVYDTMWNGTKKLAEKIAEGIGLEDPAVVVKIYNIAKSDESDVITEIFKSKTVIMGSPTVGNNIIRSMAGFTNYIKIMKFKNKKAAAFGCYGWSGEAVKILNGLMEDAGFEIASEGYRNLWNPDLDAEKEAIEYGRKIAVL